MKTLFISSPRRFVVLLILGLMLALCAGSVRSQDDDGLPRNLGRELHSLVQWRKAQPAAADPATLHSALRSHLDRNRARVQTDAAGSVVVNIHLDGTVSAEKVKKDLGALGLTVTAEHIALRADGRDGSLTAHLPLDKAVAAANTPGVFSVLVARRPHVRAGAVTSQGVSVLDVNAVQSAGYTGAGITVGVISDSYNEATAASAGYRPVTNAAQDVASGDLPSGVVVLQDDPDPVDDMVTDEGRAMMQIIHDVAPGAALDFCYSGQSQNELAANIRSLRINSQAPCNVIADDIIFYDEPYFSDGPAAQAVDNVVTSTSLGGNPVIYYSAAGNEGDLSYQADFIAVSDAAGRALSENVDLTQVPDSLTAGGFQNFKAADIGKGTKIVQSVTVSGADATINFQWDDPFISGGVTTDYNILVFDTTGRYRGDLSGIDDNFNTGEADEIASLPLNSDGTDTTYSLVISRGAGGSGEAKRLRYIVQEGDTVVGDYLRTAQPTIYGHPAAANADGVAAYDVHDISTPEYYESFGPVTIYFDANGNRLSTPEVREQPTIATVDGVDTTFFPEGPLEAADGSGTDSDNDGYPNFYGTSAAAPHAAGVAALLLQAAGGKTSLTAARMRTLLESTAAAHVLTAATAVANFTSTDGLFNVSLTAKGDASNNSAFDSKFFTLTFTGPAGSSLHKAIIDIGAEGEDFDPTVANGYPFTIGEATNVLKANLIERLSVGADNVNNAHLVLKFPAGNFPSGGILQFGIDRDNAAAGNGGNDAVLLDGATVSAKFILPDGTTDNAQGTLSSTSGAGYSPDVGYGLINAEAALLKLKGE